MCGGTLRAHGRFVSGTVSREALRIRGRFVSGTVSRETLRRKGRFMRGTVACILQLLEKLRSAFTVN